jgi:hypothetical protein
MGVLPTLFLKPMEPAVTRVVQRVNESRRVNVRALASPSGVVLADDAGESGERRLGSAGAPTVGLR